MITSKPWALLDSNILLDLFTDDPLWGPWSRDTLVQVNTTHHLAINPVVYSELSIGFLRIEDLEGALSPLPIAMKELPREALFLAGKAFLQYRKTPGTKTTTLPDFFIGAHAAVEGWLLVTRDPRRIRRSYPRLQILSPESLQT